MKMHWRALFLVASGLSLFPACGDDENTGSAIGEVCTGNVNCAEGLRCDTRGFCTKSCGAHADCGCAAGTTDSQIAASSCQVACVTSICVKVCTSDAQCAGESLCTSGVAFSSCS